MAGIGYYQFIEKLEKDFEQRKEETVEELCKLMKKILRPENFMISYTGERESMETVQKLAGAVKAGLGTEPVEKSKEKLTCTKKNEDLRLPDRSSMWLRPVILRKRPGIYRSTGNSEGYLKL